MNTLLDLLSNHNDEPAEGGRLRDEAFTNLLTHRPVLIRRLQRKFLQLLLDNGPSTSDAIRDEVPIPPGVDPRVVGAAAAMLSKQYKLTTSVGAAKTRRKVAHARRMEVWALRDEDAARLWLITHPELATTAAADTDDPFAV